MWPGQPMTAHWGVADPAHVEGTLERANAFREALRLLSRRIDLFTNLPVDSLDLMALRRGVRDIGQVSE